MTVENNVGTTRVMIDDVRIEVRTRNNVLWHEVFDNYPNVAAFCRATSGLTESDQAAVGGFLNLVRAPYNSRNVLTPKAARLCRACRRLPDDLFPPALYAANFPRRMVAEIPSDRLVSLRAAEHLALPPMQESGLDQSHMRAGLLAALKTLTPREEKVIRLRWGLDDDGEPHTLEKIGESFGVQRERIRQIEAKALRKLREPRRSRHLRPLLAARPGSGQ